MATTPGRDQPRSDPSMRALLDRIREDAPVTRRDYLRILVTVSGGLVAGTAAVALGAFRRHGAGAAPRQRIASDIRPGGSVMFRYPGAEDPAIAVRLRDGTLVGYSAVCTHLSCAVLWRADRERLECPCHDGVFDPATGGVLAGPPPRSLPKVRLRETTGGIYAMGTEP